VVEQRELRNGGCIAENILWRDTAPARRGTRADHHLLTFVTPNLDLPVSVARRAFVVPSLLLLAALTAGCSVGEHGATKGGGGSAGGSDSLAAPASRADSSPSTLVSNGTVSGSTAGAAPATAALTVANRTVGAVDVEKEFPIVRALYVNRFAAQSTKRMKRMIKWADDTEINALVIDMKDEFGLNYHPSNPEWAKNAGASGTIRNLPALLDTLRAHHILPIARMVVFKDSVTARLNPAHTIRKQDGSVWRDKKGLAWVNPYDHAIWNYNIGVAEELGKMGFGEIQFDYIRFPEPYPSLPPQVFPGEHGKKSDALAAFLKEANGRLDKLGVRTTADIFGLVTTVQGPLEVGQEWEKLAPVTDVLLPMTYPSHYPHGSFGIKSPNAEPYQTIKIAITKAHERNMKLGIKGEHVRPWLQAFTLGQPHYGAEEIRQQKRAVYDSGYDGWVLWSPGSKYEEFIPGLEKTLVSRKK
jgi:hypothetical protein